MKLCLYQPDFPHNVGAAIRLAVCFGAPLHIIEPCGFPFSVKAVRQTGLDYVDAVEIVRHNSWAAFLEAKDQGRLVLLTTSGADLLWDVAFKSDDWLLLGREAAGVPAEVHAAADLRVKAPMAAGARSLNVVMAGAIVLGEAARQLNWRGAAPLSD